MSRRPQVQVVDDDDEEFNDDTDLPLPGNRSLANTGTHGALLEEISSTASSSSAYTPSTSQVISNTNPAANPSSSSFMDAFAGLGLGKGPEGVDPNDPFYKQYMAAQASHAGSTVIPPGSEKLNEFKNWTCIYPIYIDAKRAYGTGQRRIARDKSVWWPRSLEISQAALKCGLRVFHEPTKRHPRDWENPGRVKVLWKQDGKLVDSRIPSKKTLFEMISLKIQQVKPSMKPDLAALSASDNASVVAPGGDKTLESPAQRSKGAGGKGDPKKLAIQGATPSKRDRRRPLPQPPLPLPPLSERFSPYSPLVPSGLLLDLWKPANDKTPAGGQGAPGATPGAGDGSPAGKGKRKVIRVRG